MKNIFFLFFVICLSACTKHGTVIEGTLPSDAYDKEAVYWVPVEGDHPRPVDSTHINKNKFRLVITERNHNKMGVVRVRPPYRLELQEILVFIEPGIVQLKLDTISSATGTPLNEVLQNWKDKKQTCEREAFALRKKLGTAGANDEVAIKKEIENIFTAHYDDIFKIVAENKENEVGKFIFSHYKSVFTPEQIALIENDSKSNNKNE